MIMFMRYPRTRSIGWRWSSSFTKMSNTETVPIERVKTTSWNKGSQGYLAKMITYLKISQNKKPLFWYDILIYTYGDKYIFPVPYLHNNYCLKLGTQRVEQHTGFNWLIHGTKQREESQLQVLISPAEYTKFHARMYSCKLYSMF